MKILPSQVSRSRAIALALAALFLAGTTSSCGNARSGVITVASYSISKAAYDHWLAAVTRLATPNPTKEPNALEPPAFTSCVARLRLTTPQGAAHLSLPKLQARCEAQYRRVREQTTSLLVYDYQLRAEATARNVHVSSASVRVRFNQIRSEQFPSLLAFRRALSSSQQTLKDLLFEVETQLLAAKLETHPNGVSELQRILHAHWKSRTSCQPGYVVPGCQQYAERGSRPREPASRSTAATPAVRRLSVYVRCARIGAPAALSESCNVLDASVARRASASASTVWPLSQ